MSRLRIQVAVLCKQYSQTIFILGVLLGRFIILTSLTIATGSSRKQIKIPSKIAYSIRTCIHMIVQLFQSVVGIAIKYQSHFSRVFGICDNFGLNVPVFYIRFTFYLFLSNLTRAVFLDLSFNTAQECLLGQWITFQFSG